jgi:hypothetical protein
MKPTEIEGWNRALGAPEGWDEERDGKCNTLYVRGTEHREGSYRLVSTMTSAWVPTSEELAALNAGKPVLLTVYGSSHPPVMLRVETQASPEDKVVTKA